MTAPMFISQPAATPAVGELPVWLDTLLTPIRELPDLVRLQASNTTVVVFGATLLGVAAGLIGTFALLRKRALMSDTLAHAALPGIAGAYLVAVALGVAGRQGWVLLLGAAVAGVFGVLLVHAIRRHSRLTEDAAMGAVLSVTFGVGVVLLSRIQQLPTGDQGGVKSFIFGQTAGMLAGDAVTMAVAAVLAIVAALLLLKEFRLLCFDPEFAAVQGWPTQILDLAMMGLVVLVTVVGMRAVGLILIVAMLIVPPAAARFWAERLGVVLTLSAFFGGLGGYAGAVASALFPRLPAGPVIVCAAGLIFVASLLFAPSRGVLAGLIRRVRLRLRILREHLLRGLYEHIEARDSAVRPGSTAPAPELLARREWTPLRLLMLRRWLAPQGLVAVRDGLVTLTHSGFDEAARLTRNHRLWERYLLDYADIAPSHVDRAADYVEHVLAPELVAELEQILRERGRHIDSPHPLPLRVPAGEIRPARQPEPTPEPNAGPSP